MQQQEKTMSNKNIKLNEYQLHEISKMSSSTLRQINGLMPSDWLDDAPELTDINRGTRRIIKVKMDLPFLENIFKAE